VYGNSYLLHTAFVNILDNACKYASEKVCWVRLSKEHNTLQIECCNAIDYAPEIDPKLWFSPFYRDPHTQKIAGSGIGLYLCEKILRLHQADITPLVDNNMRVCMQLRFPLL
jgi:signal transduction histidine kinase